jgi:hypothetical protein
VTFFDLLLLWASDAADRALPLASVQFRGLSLLVRLPHDPEASAAAAARAWNDRPDLAAEATATASGALLTLERTLESCDGAAAAVCVSITHPGVLARLRGAVGRAIIAARRLSAPQRRP